jgi:hypothetical protein
VTFLIKIDPHNWFFIYCYPWLRKFYRDPISLLYHFNNSRLNLSDENILLTANQFNFKIIFIKCHWDKI